MMLKYYTKRYEVITQGTYPANRKKLMLANLMSEMEASYDMPMHRNPDWDMQNAEISELYRKISDSKKL
ncbi:hypothetical protein B0H99_106249 [Planomicrobium soli]|uniref:Uncharacterized protein n=1 Tax=Planomicrobium soli TaxID=1176648 RepID=A0A2P8H1Y4_9BACL|nr:hypothetical protein [Planomicrobium soli]PSL40229.1 hypothetical protein B0H99_106249 [Planomicrobium soli]